MKNIIRNYLIFISGVYFLSAGIVFIVRSMLGTTPISSINYVLSLNTPLSLGTCTFLVNVALILGQFWLIRDRWSRRDAVEILLQIPFSLLFGLFIDLNMWLTHAVHPQHYAMSLALLAAGCLAQAVGIVLEIKPRVAMMSGEGFVKYASQRYGRDFGRLKVAFDVSLVTAAALLSYLCARRIEGVREGTFVAALATGFLVNFLNRRIMTRAMLRRIVPERIRRAVH